MEKDEQLGIIILAAGKASRMGEPKALLTYQANSFLLNTYNLAQSVHPKGIVTVLGHYFEQMSTHCNTHKIPFALNEAYENGMSSSIQCGLTYLLSYFPKVTTFQKVTCSFWTCWAYLPNSISNYLIT